MLVGDPMLLFSCSMTLRTAFFCVGSALLALSCDDDGWVRNLPFDGSSDASDSAADSGSDSALADQSNDRGDASSAAYPNLLSATGLFSNVATEALAPGVRAFQPKYALWSDDAAKRRWLYLPAGQAIDTSDMDYWQYPVGTKVWKEFTRDGQRIETRMLHKAGPLAADWVMIAYQWNAAQTDAVAVPDGVQNAGGTAHDIPDQATCQSCHGGIPDVLLGVTAVQLSHSLGGVTLSTLAGEGSLTVNPPSAGYTIPGGALAEPALGVLHANCGHCHNPRASVYITRPLDLWESTNALATLEQTRAYVTAVSRTNSFNGMHTIEPGLPDQSTLVVRMTSRTAGIQMPPLATELVDTAGLAAVRAFIESLPRVTDGGADAAPGDSGDSGGALDGG